MFRLVNNRFIHFALAAAGLFMILLWILPTNRLIELMNSIFIFVAVAFTIVLAPGICRAVSHREFDRISQAAVGIFCLAGSIVVSRVGNIVGRVVGDFDVVANSALIAAAVYLGIVGALLLVTAPGMVDGKWRYNRGLVFGAILAGVAMAVSVFLLQIQVFQ